MENKKLIMGIKEKLDVLLEIAPEEDELEDQDLINFYAEAQNLKESIETLQNSNYFNNSLNCYIVTLNLILKNNEESFRRIMVFSEDIADAYCMINEAFIKNTDNFIDKINFEKVNPRDYEAEYPETPQFRILTYDCEYDKVVL